MTVSEAGKRRWNGVSREERRAIGAKGAATRVRRRVALREAAAFALKALEELSAADEGGERISVDCLKAIPRLKEALAT